MLSLQEQAVRSFFNVRDMLKYRGVDVTAIEDLGEPEISALARTQNVFTIEVNPDLFVVFYLTKMKVAEFNTAMFGNKKELSSENMDKMHIFVFKDDPNTINKNHINEHFPKNEIFNMKSTLIQPHLHMYVPKHRKLNEEEIKAVLEKHHIESKSQLPSIFSTDPMAKFVGLVPGDVVEITRCSPTAGSYFYYRLCV